MRPRVAGRIAVGVLIIVFAVLAILYAWHTEPEKLYHGLRAVTAAILALTGAISYRYFED